MAKADHVFFVIHIFGWQDDGRLQVIVSAVLLLANLLHEMPQKVEDADVESVFVVDGIEILVMMVQLFMW